MPLDMEHLATLGVETNRALAAMLDGDETAIDAAAAGCAALYGDPRHLSALAFVHRMVVPGGSTGFVAEFWELHAPRLVDRMVRAGDRADAWAPLMRSEQESAEAEAFARALDPVSAYLHETEDGWWAHLYTALCQVPPAERSALCARLPGIARRAYASTHAALFWGQLQMSPTEDLVVLHLDRPDGLVLRASDVTAVGRLHLHLGMKLSRRPAWHAWTDGWKPPPWVVKRETHRGPPMSREARAEVAVQGCLRWTSWFRLGPQAEGAGDAPAGSASGWLDARRSLAHVPRLHGHRVLRVRTEPAEVWAGDVPWPLAPHIPTVRSLNPRQVTQWHARVKAAHHDPIARRGALVAELHRLGLEADLWAGQYSAVPHLRDEALALRAAWSELGDVGTPLDAIRLHTVVGNLQPNALGDVALDEAVALARRHDLLDIVDGRRAVQWRARRWAIAGDLPGLRAFVRELVPQVREAAPATAAVLLSLLAEALPRAGEHDAARETWREFAAVCARVVGPAHTRVTAAQA
jgi:hypothetical protein